MTKPPPKPPQFITYARFSPRPNAEDCESVENQQRQLLEYADKAGGVVCGVFSDKALSGADHDREGLWRAIRACKRGYTLLVTKSDRLARDLMFSESLHARARTRGFKIIALDGSIRESKDPLSVLMRQIFAAIAEYQRAETRAATSRGMRRHQANGRPMSKRPPYGQRIVQDVNGNDMLVEDADEQATLQIILRLAKEGRGPSQIGKFLDSQDIHARGGQDWHHATLTGILKRELEPTS